jgi:hypothetical protein
MDAAAAPDAYLVYAWIRDIHPLLWRRVLVRADSTLADLHWTLQILFCWTDFHLHRFRIRKTDYAIPRHGLLEGHDARRVRLTDLAFRPNERFLYEYDFGDLWQLEVRIERRVSIAPRRTYPMCIGGRWGGPPEDCGGPEAFLEQRDAAPWRVHELLGAIADAVTAKDTEALDGPLEELATWRKWLTAYRFNRRAVNRRLRQYAQGDDNWRRAEGEGKPCD